MRVRIGTCTSKDARLVEDTKMDEIYKDMFYANCARLWKQAAKKWRRSSIRNNDRYTVMLGRRAYAEATGTRRLGLLRRVMKSDMINIVMQKNHEYREDYLLICDIEEELTED
jgi:hypothetical protein